MASVILVNPNGPEEVVVSDVWTFNAMVYGQGWHPKTGSVDTAWQSIVSGLAASPTETSLAGWSVEDLIDAPLMKTAFGRAAPVLASFSYDAATGNLLSYTEDGITIILTYNADGTVATSQRGTDPAQTFTYSGGNLVGVA